MCGQPARLKADPVIDILFAEGHALFLLRFFGEFYHLIVLEFRFVYLLIIFSYYISAVPRNFASVPITL